MHTATRPRKAAGGSLATFEHSSFVHGAAKTPRRRRAPGSGCSFIQHQRQCLASHSPGHHFSGRGSLAGAGSRTIRAERVLASRSFSTRRQRCVVRHRAPRGPAPTAVEYPRTPDASNATSRRKDVHHLRKRRPSTIGCAHTPVRTNVPPPEAERPQAQFTSTVIRPGPRHVFRRPPRQTVRTNAPGSPRNPRGRRPDAVPGPRRHAAARFTGFVHSAFDIRAFSRVTCGKNGCQDGHVHNLL